GRHGGSERPELRDEEILKALRARRSVDQGWRRPRPRRRLDTHRIRDLVIPFDGEAFAHDPDRVAELADPAEPGDAGDRPGAARQRERDLAIGLDAATRVVLVLDRGRLAEPPAQQVQE